MARPASLVWQSCVRLRAMSVTSHRHYLYEVLKGLREHYPHLYEIVMRMCHAEYAPEWLSLFHYGKLLERGKLDKGPVNSRITSICFRLRMRYDEYFALYDMSYSTQCVIKNIRGKHPVHISLYCMTVHKPDTVRLNLCMNCWRKYKCSVKSMDRWVESKRKAYELKQTIITYDLPLYLNNRRYWCSKCCTWLLFTVHQTEYCNRLCQIDYDEVYPSGCTLLSSTMVEYDMSRHFDPEPLSCKRKLFLDSDSE